MSGALTAIRVEKLKARINRYEVPDRAQRGLYVVVFPSGKKSFVVRYRYGRIKRKLTLGGISLAAARKAAAAALYEVHEGRDPAEAAKQTKQKNAAAATNTVQAICEEYLEREGKKLRTVDERKREFKRLIYPAIGNVAIDALKRIQIARLLDKIQDDSGDRTADLALAYLRKVFNWCATRDNEFSSPIVRGMGRYNAKERARSRTLTDDEIRKLWAATKPGGNAPNPFHALVRFLLLTGARRDEAREMPYSEINGIDWELPAARNKVKVDLIRPLSEAARAVIAGQPRIDNGALVFTYNGHHPLQPSKPKRALDAAAGVTGWTIHDLRRTARTLLSRTGVNPDHAERCLGHVIGGVRKVYDRYEYRSEKLHAFEALAAQIERIVNPTDNVTPLRRRKRE
jgi:integrase